ncbi:TPR repeat-containing domain protein [Trichinella spiralis]|uniref:TPR repeat-containing domain protein n=1 Tax=Trichinella spiralis TaxID=6334 RepID=UPI0001EFCB4A|nr:TPR repeat-containing domain protein [Trichinella spiralis]
MLDEAAEMYLKFLDREESPRLREPMKRLLNEVNKLNHGAKDRQHSKKNVSKADVTETSVLDLVENINDYGHANEEAIISEFLAEVLKCDDNRGESESETALETNAGDNLMNN